MNITLGKFSSISSINVCYDSSLDSSRNGGGGYGMCEGDCDYDSDCDAGLRCFQRDGYEAVRVFGSGKKGWDYCVLHSSKIDFNVRLMDFPDPESQGEVGAQAS